LERETNQTGAKVWREEKESGPYARSLKTGKDSRSVKKEGRE